MIVCKTPFRVSLFGGGTDFPEFFNKHGGMIIGGSINKFCYITLRNLPKFHNHKFEVHYSKIEKVKNINKIRHPVIRACYKIYKLKPYINLNYDADMPEKSGLGTSSSFTVSLIKSIYKYKKKKLTKEKLLKKSIFLERNYLKEAVGCQDQTLAVYGGFNLIKFSKKNIIVKKIKISKKALSKLENNLFLVYTNSSRYASRIEKKKISQIRKRKKIYFEILKITNEAIDVFKKNQNMDLIGNLLDKYWNLKKNLSGNVANKNINNLYKQGIRSGALGGKLLGAGGGGFMLFYCPKKNHKKFMKNMASHYLTSFKFSNQGSKIIHSS